jgi:hypothetical protein
LLKFTTMKKLVLLSLFMVAMATAAFAQPRAIGGRLGYGFEVSYQHTLSEENMVSVDLGLPGFGGLEAAATYDWLNPGGLMIPWEEKGEWNWYAGVGAGAGFYGFSDIRGFVGAAGRIGVEYNFWFPLQLSLDWRPLVGAYFNEAGAGFNTDGLFYGGIALGVRYLF